MHDYTLESISNKINNDNIVVSSDSINSVIEKNTSKSIQVKYQYNQELLNQEKIIRNQKENENKKIETLEDNEDEKIVEIMEEKTDTTKEEKENDNSETKVEYKNGKIKVYN